MSTRLISFMPMLIPIVSILLVSPAGWAGQSENAWEALNAEIVTRLEQGDSAGALQAGREAVRMAQNSFGPKHMKTAVALKKLADLERLNGNLKASSASLRQASQLWSTNLGARHPFAAEVLIESAGDLANAEDWTAAETDLQEAIRAQKAYYGKNHTVIATTLQELARVQRRAAKWPQSLQNEAEAADILLAVLEPGHPRTLMAFQELAAHRAEMGDTSAARRDLRKVLASVERGTRGFGGPLASTYALEGDLALQDGDRVAAEASFLKSLELLEPLDTSANLQRLSVLYKLRELYQSSGRDEAAERVAEQARQLESSK